MANMSTAAGVGALLREIYRFFISIGYTTEDTVHFPPHPPEVFQEAAYKANDLDENAINTLRFIPSPKSFPGRGEVELFYRAQPPCHGIPDFFGETRHPILPEFDVEEDFHDHLPPYMITLAFGKYEEGQTIVLDAQNMTIREYSSDFGLYSSDAVDACTFLKNVLKTYTRFDDIPINGAILGNGNWDILDEADEYVTEKTRSRFIEHGFPNAFRRDDFNHNIEQIQNEWRHEAFHLRNTREPKQNAIGTILVAIYQHLVKIGYVHDHDVSWPQGRGSEWWARWKKAGYNITGMELIRLIPWMRDINRPLLPYSEAVSWEDAATTKQSRYPTLGTIGFGTMSEQQLELYELKRNEIPITLAATYNTPGTALIIDASKGKLQYRKPDTLSNTATSYLSTSANGWLDAVPALETILKNYSTLHWIPVGQEIITYSDGKHVLLKAALIEYGWPDNFDVANWREEIAWLWKEWDSVISGNVSYKDALNRLPGLVRDMARLRGADDPWM